MNKEKIPDREKNRQALRVFRIFKEILGEQSEKRSSGSPDLIQNTEQFQAEIDKRMKERYGDNNSE